MFRTLQQTGGVISIFHNPEISLLSKLLKILNQADSKFNNEKQQFTIDKVINTIPTYDQYLSITNNCLKDNYSKNVLKNSFPFISGKQDTPQGKDRVTVKSPIAIGNLANNGLRTFNEHEYLLIFQAFEEALKSKEFEVSDIFHQPLVIDWDQYLIANDEFGLQGILKKYNGE